MMFRRGKHTQRAALVALAVGAFLFASVYPEGWKAQDLLAAATAPPLGSAGSFAVLAAAGVTNTGATVLNGDLGTHPTPAITGFFGTTGNEGPGLVNPPGTIHQADAAALAARNALTAAYNNAAGQVVDFTVGTELGGQNLVPGVYNSAAGTFEITGTLTLTGGANDVWVFKTASTLVTAGSSVVTLASGAQARNVYWQVGSDATLGASSTFRGNILANRTISLGNGASVVGRLLAGAVDATGAVTLIANSISAPLVPPTLGKGFLPISITAGGVSTLTIVLSNPNTNSANLTAPLSDTLPAGVVIAALPAASTTCAGSGAVVAAAGGTTVTLPATRTIPAGLGAVAGTCTVTVNVTAPLAGVYPNTLAAGALQTSNGNNAAPAVATLTVVAPPAAPTLAKGFLPISILAGGASTLTIVLSNPNLVAATLTAPLIDTLPAGVQIHTTPNASTTCGAGVVTAAAGGATVTLTGGAIPAGVIGTPGTCTVTVSVEVGAAGVRVNTLAAGALQTSNGNNAAAVTATLTVVPAAGPPTLAKGFLPVSINQGGVSTLTVVLSNPNLVAATLTAPLTDTLPAGVVTAAAPNASTTCGTGVVTAAAGGATVTLTGGAILGGAPGTCTVTVDVTAATAGVYVNTLVTGALQTSNGNNAAPAVATLTVVAPPAPPTLAKGFVPVSINQGGVSTLTVVLSNPNLVAAALTAPLSDTLPAGVLIHTTPNASTTCGAGVVTAAAGGATMTLTGGAIPAGVIGTPGTCTVTVDVTGPVGGSYINTLAAGALQTSNGNNAAPVSATLTVVPPPPSGGGGGGGGAGFTPPTPTVTSGYVFLSSAFCRVEVCPFGQQQLQVGQQMYATFKLNRVPAAPVRAEAYWNGAQYTSLSWLEPYGSIGPFTTGTLLGASPDAGIVELRVWVGTTYAGAFTATVVNPFVRGTCPGNGANCPQVVGPSSGVRLPTLGTTLHWWNPPGTAQVHLQVMPANNDGPAINLILGSPITSFPVPEPIFGTGEYTILPGMTYTWRVRVTSQTTPAREADRVWGAWADPHTFQTRTASSDRISLISPTNHGNMDILTPLFLWSNSDTGIFYYEVQLSADPEFNSDPATAIASVYWNLVHGGARSPANSWMLPSGFALEPGTTYHWRVRPRIQGDGTPVSWSQASSFRTP